MQQPLKLPHTTTSQKIKLQIVEAENKLSYYLLKGVNDSIIHYETVLQQLRNQLKQTA